MLEFDIYFLDIELLPVELLHSSESRMLFICNHTVLLLSKDHRVAILSVERAEHDPLSINYQLY